MGHDLNIRNAGKEFIATLKSEAALAGKTLRDYCLGILESRGKPKMLRQTLPSGAVTCVLLPDGTTAPYLQTNDPGLTMGIERREPTFEPASDNPADVDAAKVANAMVDYLTDPPGDHNLVPAEDVDRIMAEVKPASQIEKPKTHRCPRCDSKLVPWGTKVWRCVKCSRNYTETELGLTD